MEASFEITLQMHVIGNSAQVPAEYSEIPRHRLSAAVWHSARL